MEKGKRKKWLIALAILVLLAIVAVCLVLFLPKNTDNVVKQTHAQVETMFLKGEDDEKMYSSFEDKIKLHADTYTAESQSVRKVSVMLSRVLEFYNMYLVYAQNNSTFQANYNLIIDGFNTANNFQTEMNKVLTEVYEKVNASSTFTEGAWIDFKEEFTEYIKGYANALQGLNKVFKDCVPDGVLHNNLTFLVCNTIDDFLKVINEKGIENQYIISYAYNFVDKYIISTQSPTLIYKYDEGVQAKVKLINEFSSVYGNDQSIKNVIESIDASGITYKISEADNSGRILNEVKTFLNGGLEK